MKKKTTAWIITLLHPPKKDLRQTRQDLTQLKSSLEKAMIEGNKIKATVRIFTSFPLIWEDKLDETVLTLKRKDYGQLTETIEALKAISSMLKNPHHDDCNVANMNKENDPVSEDKIIIGGSLGQHKFPASYWISNEDAIRKEYPNIWHSAHGMAEKFTEWYIPTMLKNITVVLSQHD
jgi:hypothetical protein